MNEKSASSFRSVNELSTWEQQLWIHYLYLKKSGLIQRRNVTAESWGIVSIVKAQAIERISVHHPATSLKNSPPQKMLSSHSAAWRMTARQGHRGDEEPTTDSIDYVLDGLHICAPKYLNWTGHHENWRPSWFRSLSELYLHDLHRRSEDQTPWPCFTEGSESWWCWNQPLREWVFLFTDDSDQWENPLTAPLLHYWFSSLNHIRASLTASGELYHQLMN